ncbi:MAG: gliding motility-associated ABC transporter ATP-binding subunit GldA [Bacteroidia bacterium]|nr:gliding motility-associated ABC transporter ATP-binding subunit GldA [Bacteroidia bacterium]
MGVEVSNLVKMYGEQRAVDGISFSVQPGHILGFLGPNGAGKSTTMKIITCYLPQTEGEVKVCGYDVVHQSLEVKKCIGYLPEHNPLYLDMYVKEYLEFVAGVHRLGAHTAKAVDAMIERTGLTREYKKRIGELSKGYRQRVGLAQAMIHDPQVLILDEPTSGLDPNQITEIRDLIREIGKNKTVILSTHIMQEVKALCNRVVIINKGKLVADETPENLQHDTGNQLVFVAEFKGEFSPKNLHTIQGVEKTVSLGQNKFRIISGRDIREDLFSFAVNNKLVLLSVSMEDQSLEDVFRKLTS